MHSPPHRLLVAALLCAALLARSLVVVAEPSHRSGSSSSDAIEEAISDVEDAVEISILPVLKSVVGGANGTAVSPDDLLRRQLTQRGAKKKTWKSKKQREKDLAAARKLWWQQYWSRQRQQQQSKKIPKHLVYPTCVGQTGDTAEITITNSMQGTTWQGWGTALAWSGTYLGQLGKRARLLNQLLFNKTTGMGLTRVRYLIPGGYKPNRKPRKGHFPPSLQPWPGKWKWSADWPQIMAVRRAMRLGVTHVDAISYSAPWWMTLSGQTSGNVGGKPNTNPLFYKAYADYLARITMHYRKWYGIQFASISPYNEALEQWWKLGDDREGDSWDADGIVSFSKLLRKRLNLYGQSNVPIVGVDSWPEYSNNALKTSVFPRLNGELALASVHGYRPVSEASLQADEEVYSAVRRNAQKAGVGVMQSEWGPIQVGGSDIDVALFMTRSVAQHINIMGATAWYFWQALTQFNGGYWGAIMQHQNPHKKVAPFKTRQFYAIRHYSHWWHEDSLPITITRSCYHAIAAVYSPRLNYVVVTITNQEDRAITMKVTLQGYSLVDSSKPAFSEIFVTSQKFKYTRLKDWNEDNIYNPFVVYLRPKSVTTLAVHNLQKS